MLRVFWGFRTFRKLKPLFRFPTLVSSSVASDHAGDHEHTAPRRACEQLAVWLSLRTQLLDNRVQQGAGIKRGLLQEVDARQFTVDTSRVKNGATGASANLSLIQK